MLGFKRTWTSSSPEHHGPKRHCPERTVVFAGLGVDTSRVPSGTQKVVIREANGVTAEDLAAIARCETITDFTMKHWPQEQEGLDQLAKLKHLAHLNLKGNFNLRDKALKVIAALPLSELKLSGCYSLTGEGLVHAPAQGINSIDLNGCLKFQGANLAHVAAIGSLQKLNLTNCNNVTDEFLHLLLPLLNLEVLIFGWCPGITDKGLEVLAKLAQLRMLTLNGCPVSGEGFVHFRRDGPLVELEMKDCPLTSAGCEQLPGSLLALDVTRCKSLTAADIATIARKAPNLEALSFSYCWQVTEAMYPALLSLLHLTHLKISNYSANKAVAFESLCKMQNLTHLVTGLYAFTQEKMQELREALPNTNIVAFC